MKARRLFGLVLKKESTNRMKIKRNEAIETIMRRKGEITLFEGGASASAAL